MTSTPMASMRPARVLFPLTVVVGSFLLFLTQPMIARMALPRLGGAPAVWNSAMLVYQGLLLAGYAYAHALTRMRGSWQPVIHVGLLACAALWLPMGVGSGTLPADADPVLWTPAFLLASIGPLFLVVSSQAPLMQSWYAADAQNGDPYPLYAASNAGSFAGLLSYPFLIEPLFTLRTQSLIWGAGYALLAGLTIACAIVTPRTSKTAEPPVRSAAPGAVTVARWILLAAIPSGLMLSTTTYLTTDVVAIPMLWVLPLSIYLLSFIVAFATKRAAADAATLCAPLILLIGGGFVLSNSARTPLIAIILGSLTLYVVSVAIHAELNRTKPSSDRLTGFYLCMSVGGVVGGAFCALFAPAVFNWVYEHPILLVAAALVLPLKPLSGTLGLTHRMQWTLAAISMAACMVSILMGIGLVTGIAAAVISTCGFVLVIKGSDRFAYVTILVALLLTCGGWFQIDMTGTHLRTRSYFGSYRVIDEGRSRLLLHGTTTHGIQRRDPLPRTDPISYYSATSGVGRVMADVPDQFGDRARIGVVGLGAGVLACYRRPGETWRFYEIDPEIVRIAQDPSLFTYMQKCDPGAKVVIGDARLTVDRDAGARYDVLVLDAFSSDAVPLHLLTRQAFEIYGRAVDAHGIIALHISNRHVDLRGVVAATAGAMGWHSIVLDDDGRSMRNRYVNASTWVAMSRDPQAIKRLATEDARWKPLITSPDATVWTDDHASVLTLLRSF